MTHEHEDLWVSFGDFVKSDHLMEGHASIADEGVAIVGS